MTLLRTCLALAPLLFGLSATAQESGGETKVGVRCLAFQVRGVPDKLYVHDAKAPEGTEGQPVSFKGYLNHEVDPLLLLSPDLTFTTQPARESLANPKEVVAKFRMQDGLDRAILMFVPAGKDHGEPFRVIPVRDSRRAFPPGSIQVLNLSRETVRMALEQAPYEFAPGEVELIEEPPSGQNGMAAMMAFRKTDDGWQRIASSRWALPGRKRSLQIIFTNPRSERLEMMEIKDIAVPEN